MRPRMLASLCATLALIAMTMAWHSDVQAGAKSDSKVKATAKASKIGADGNQKISITLEIEKGWYIYANPVGDEDFENNKTRVSLKAKEKVEYKVTYPTGKVKVEDKIKLNIYVDKVTIETVVQRTAGDTSPLLISIDVNSCNKGTCLLPGTVKLTVP